MVAAVNSNPGQQILQFGHSVLKTISDEFTVVHFAISSMLKGAQGLAIVALDSAELKLALSIAVVAKAAFELVPIVPKFIDVTNLRNDLYANTHEPNPSESRERRIQDLTNSLTYIRDNEKRLRTTFNFTKDTGVLKLANESLAGLASANEQDAALAKGEDLVNNLRRRASTKFGIDLAKLITRIIGVIVGAILIPFTAQFSLIAMGAVGLVTLALWGIEKVMLPANPLKAPNDAWHEQISYRIRTSIDRTADAVKDFFFPKKPELATT